MSLVSHLNRAVGGTVRWVHARLVTPLHLWLRWKLLGLGNALDCVARLPTDEIPDALRFFGAQVGDRAFIKPGLRIVNAPGDLRGLVIGENVHLGSDVLIDLSRPVSIGDDAGLAARVALVTGSPEREGTSRPGAIMIGKGALISTGAVVLPGVTVGTEGVVSALTMVERNVAPGTVMAGVPARFAGEVAGRGR